jgi:hypothetical protein
MGNSVAGGLLCWMPPVRRSDRKQRGCSGGCEDRLMTAVRRWQHRSKFSLEARDLANFCDHCECLDIMPHALQVMPYPIVLVFPAAVPLEPTSSGHHLPSLTILRVQKSNSKLHIKVHVDLGSTADSPANPTSSQQRSRKLKPINIVLEILIDTAYKDCRTAESVVCTRFSRRMNP